jgi:hypothetical protein
MPRLMLRLRTWKREAQAAVERSAGKSYVADASPVFRGTSASVFLGVWVGRQVNSAVVGVLRVGGGGEDRICGRRKRRCVPRV